MPTHVDHDPESEVDTASDVVTSRDEWDLEDERRNIWKLRRMTLGFVAVFLVTLYFARDGSNEGAAFRAALFAVPAVGFLVAQIVFEVQYRRERRAHLPVIPRGGNADPSGSPGVERPDQGGAR